MSPPIWPASGKQSQGCVWQSVRPRTLALSLQPDMKSLFSWKSFLCFLHLCLPILLVFFPPSTFLLPPSVPKNSPYHLLKALLPGCQPLPEPRREATERRPTSCLKGLPLSRAIFTALSPFQRSLFDLSNNPKSVTAASLLIVCQPVRHPVGFGWVWCRRVRGAGGNLHIFSFSFSSARIIRLEKKLQTLQRLMLCRCGSFCLFVFVCARGYFFRTAADFSEETKSFMNKLIVRGPVEIRELLRCELGWEN